MDPASGMTGTIRLAAGQEHTLALAGAGSVGYVWTVQVTGTPGAVEASVRAAPRPPVAPGTVPQAGSHPQLLVVRALRAGRAEVHCELSRPLAAAPRAIRDLTVIVADG